MTLPQMALWLAEAGFERVLTDACRGTSIYYLPDGESLELPAPTRRHPVAWAFDAAAIKALIDEGRQALTDSGGLVPGFTYKNYFSKIATICP